MSHAPVHQLCCTCRATLSQLPAPCQSSPCTAVCLTIGDHRWTAAIASAVRHLLGAFISAASTADSTCAMLAAKALLPQPDGPPAQLWRVTMLNCTKTCLGPLPVRCRGLAPSSCRGSTCWCEAQMCWCEVRKATWHAYRGVQRHAQVMPGLEMPCSAASPHLHCYCRLHPQPALRSSRHPRGPQRRPRRRAGQSWRA